MRRYVYQFILLTVLCCMPALSSAQQTKVVIRGVVTAAIDKLPLPGANVLLVNKDGRVVGNAVTDMDGNYSMRVETRAGDNLVATYIGMKKATIPVKGKMTINIVMQDETVMLEGATIVGNKRVNNGMMDVSERDLTTAMSRISMSDLEDGMTAPSVEDALQGRIAGMDIAASSGDPGAGMSIRIRGTTSMTGSSQPLIVVDGFPYDVSVDDDFDFATADEEEYSQLLNVAPDDIKEITVLKDAAATALYGAKAANGVLMITTKRGTVSKPRISYTFKGTVISRPHGIETLSGDEYTTLIQEALMNSGKIYDPTADPEFAYDVNQPYYFYNYGANTNWYDEVTRTGFSQDHTASISGGGDKAQYRASIGYYNANSVVIGTGLDRINARLNVDYNISKQLKFSASMAYTRTDDRKNYISYFSTGQNATSMAFTRMPNMSVYEYNEIGLWTGNFFTPEESPQGKWNPSSSSGGVYNPVAMAKDGYFQTLSNNVVSNLSLIWRPLAWMRYQSDFSLNVSNNKKNAFLPQTATGRPWNEATVNRADDRDGEAFTIYTMNKVIFTPDLGKKHSFQGLLALTTSDKRSTNFRLTGGNLASPYLKDPSIPSRVTGASYLTSSTTLQQERSVGMMGSIQYSLLDRYIVNTTVRYDGNSRFGKENRWGLFPSVSLRWRLSGEPFMKPWKKWLNELSLRASYGLNGSSPKTNNNYTHISLYDSYEYSYLGETGVYPANLELSNLKWQTTTQVNFGMNFAAFKNRLNIDVEVYQKRSKDQYFQNLSLPSTTGFTKADVNSGSMENKGFELSVNTVPYRSKAWNISFNINLARNINSILDVPDQYPMQKGVLTTNGQYVRRFELGQPIGAIYGFRYKGVYLNDDQTIARDANGNKIYSYDASGKRTPVQMRFAYPTIDYQFKAGDAIYEDINHDGNIDYQDVVYLGNANPILTGGFGPNIRYKSVSVSAFFNFRYGNKVINKMGMSLQNMASYNNQSKAVLRRWRHPYEDEATAPTDLLPRAVYGSKNAYNYLGSDRFVEDGSFLRFKTLTVKYTFDKKQLKNTFLQSCQIWTTLSNLYVWTNYSGMDPEIALTGGAFKMGEDNSRIPRSFTATLGMSVTF
ncbi:TonB-dependent receptor [Candidatus Bacteroides intestinigallinarum]|uniref:SusC/RagA family TonB-linked outer membrane protein n=1 Tax=Bacteroides TaxID=816 RepID=UPI0002579E5B|nr:MULTISPECIES: TonB-dependent receptor [Bacteroides]EFS32112.2 SusC/RagA family TonB-linked outer membrane protein [Bacteroides sp. D2]MCS3175400.1 TonB-dependent receptor [Candidatus Bacteroides intestinigallinarum]UWO01130.1 TonB-dependent receptor [Bacteroides sp. D2]